MKNIYGIKIKDLDSIIYIGNILGYSHIEVEDGPFKMFKILNNENEDIYICHCRSVEIREVEGYSSFSNAYDVTIEKK